MTRFYFTAAPVDYDYQTCTEEVVPGMEFGGKGSESGGKWPKHWFRLVAIHDDRGGSFHEGQVPRYQSGNYPTFEVGSSEAVARGLKAAELVHKFERRQPVMRALERCTQCCLDDPHDFKCVAEALFKELGI